jgi:hypothetical protein
MKRMKPGSNIAVRGARAALGGFNQEHQESSNQRVGLKPIRVSKHAKAKRPKQDAPKEPEPEQDFNWFFYH